MFPIKRAALLAGLVVTAAGGLAGRGDAQQITEPDPFEKCLAETASDPNCRKTDHLWYDLVCGSRFELEVMECVFRSEG